jgi:hypothetical protein
LASTEIPQATAGAVLQEHVEIPGDGKTLGKPWEKGKPWENLGKADGSMDLFMGKPMIYNSYIWIYQSFKWL